MMRDVLQGTARRFKIYMADSTAPITAKTGLTSFTVYLAKDNGAETTVSPSIVERGHGWYEVTPITAHRDTLGENAWTFTAAGAVDFPYKETVVLYDAQLAAVGANTTAPDNAGITGARTAAESADAKLTAGRVSRIDRLPDVASGASGGLPLVGSAMALTPSERTTLAGVIEVEFLNDLTGEAFLAGIQSQLQALFDNGADVPVATLVNLITSGVWTHATRTLSAGVSVSGYAAGQSPGELLAGTVTKVDAIDTLLLALTEIVSSVTRFRATALSQAPAGGGGGGGLTVDQAAQLGRIEAQTSKLSGSPVEVNGNVKPGGHIVLKQGDDHTVALGNPVIVPVADTGGALHTLMAAVGVANMKVVAIRGNDPASRIEGTLTALAYSSNILTVTMQFTAAETVKGVVGPAYVYDVIKTDTPTRTYFSGKLTLTRDAR